MKTVRDILKVKGTDVWCVEPDATVLMRSNAWPNSPRPTD